MMYKYNDSYYWENIIFEKRNHWKSLFLDLPIKKDTIFINTTLINYSKDVIDTNWASYNDVKAVLGFLQYVYIPTGFFFALNDLEEIYVTIGTSEVILEELNEQFHDNNHIKIMEKFITELNTYWELDEDECKIKLKEFCRKFNAYWNTYDDKLCINLFYSINEIEKYIFESEIIQFAEVVEEEIGLSRKEFHEKFNDISENQFMSNVFLNFLNDNVGYIEY
jgi:hypothetical protein